jgi:polysaccharide biosynthesis protein PslG
MRHRRAVASLILCLILILFTTSIALAQGPVTTEEAAPPVAPVVQPAAATVPPVNSTAPTDLSVAPTGETTYTVRPGENLFRIALRFGLTTRQLAEYNGIVNPGVIYAGQVLRIPGGAAPATPTPAVPATATPVPPPTTTYTVVRGDSLIRLAVRFNTTVAQLIALNNLPNPNVIYIGQVLNIPSGGTTLVPVPTSTGEAAPILATPTVTPDGAVASTPTSDPGLTTAPTGYGFGYGIEAYLVDQDVITLTDEIVSLGVEWVKQDIFWRDFEPIKGEIDFNTLDNIVNTLRENNLNILFTVSAAPDWARTSTDENGPPDNFADYGAFVGALAARYAGQVQAYEIWNEPNLRREWNSTIHNISAASYIELLRTGYTAIKAADASAVVVSGGLSPTGFNDGVNAINDRLFLDALYIAGLGDVSDAIGAHPLGWANPPDTLCCEPPVGVETHYQDGSFYFQETLNAYRNIMVQKNDSSTAIWVTKYGWGTSEDTDPPSENYVFVSYTTLGEQAIYDARGFELGAELGFIGPMFLDNLNGCQVQLGTVEPCYYALVGSDGAPRPAFAAVQAIINPPTIDEPAAPPAETTTEPQPTVEAPTVEAPTQESVSAPVTEATLPPLPTDAPIDPAATPEAP